MTATFPNLAQVLAHQADRLGSRVALRQRRLGLYRDVSWAAYAERSASIAAGLVAVGVKPGDRVALLAENSADWLMTDMGILWAGAVTVSPHATATAAQVRYQFADAEVVWAFASDDRRLATIDSVRGELPALRGVTVLTQSLHAFLRLAAPADRLEASRRLAATSPADLATIMYTSGTTGAPKGVMLTHGNLLSNAEASLAVQRHTPSDLVLSWLPYTHIYARLIDHYMTMMAGITVAVADSAESVVEQLGELHPTHMASVPRLYEKVLAAVRSPDPGETGKRLRRVFGPRVDWLSSGGAPLPVAVCREYRDAGLFLRQGYGLTETSPVISFNTREHDRLGSVGRPIPGVEVKIADDGEILTRGPHVMPGYYKDAAATADAIRDGWFHTGDLGRIDGDGYLYVTGRKKELLVLSNGKKVIPSYIEGLLAADAWVDQVIIVGEGRNFLAAMIHPNRAVVEREFGGGLSTESLAEQLLSRCRNRLAELSQWEQVKKVLVLDAPFRVEADELTVSLKMKRAVILGNRAAAVEALYAGG